MSLDEQLITEAGGLSVDGQLQSPSALWHALAGAPSVRVLSDRGIVVGEIRMMPSGAGVYLDLVERRYALLGPEELAYMAQETPGRVALAL